MTNIYGVPEISVQDVATRIKSGENLILLDVRENMELIRANLGDDVIWVPLSRMASERLKALPTEILDNKENEIVVFCHHGVRSAQVAAWLAHEGWQKVLSMAGGIDAYAQEIDPTIGKY
jgi:rhodanese-related sulfurtransferase